MTPTLTPTLLLLVGLGGMAGTVLRFLTVQYVNGLIPASLPFGTLYVNVFGSLLLGALVGLGERFAFTGENWYWMLSVGLLSGYTTFAIFAFEATNLLYQDKAKIAFIYIMGSLILSIGAVVVGFWLTRR
jgi:CrcB protein